MEARPEARFPSSAAAEAVGSALVEWEAVATRGYARSCAHWRAVLADGRRVFIKHALTATAVEWLQAERVIYEAVREPFMPSFFAAYDDGELAGGPPPWQVLPGAGPLAAAVAGFFAVRAGLQPPPTAPTVRDFQRAQAQVALAWTARELDVPAP